MNKAYDLAKTNSVWWSIPLQVGPQPHHSRLSPTLVYSDTADTLTGDPQVQLVFRSGLVVRVSTLGGRLRLVILLPWSLFGEGVWRGLLGSPDFNPDNDLTPAATSGDAQSLDPDSSADIKYIYGESCKGPVIIVRGRGGGGYKTGGVEGKLSCTATKSVSLTETERGEGHMNF